MGAMISAPLRIESTAHPITRGPSINRKHLPFMSYYLDPAGLLTYSTKKASLPKRIKVSPVSLQWYIKPLLSAYSDEFVQDFHLFPFSPAKCRHRSMRSYFQFCATIIAYLTDRLQHLPAEKPQKTCCNGKILQNSYPHTSFLC